MKEKDNLVVGIGSALVDILIHENDDFLQGAGAVKGGMTYVPSQHIDETLVGAKSEPSIVPGGSACNTIVGIGNLGGQARFVGKLGNDGLGNLFQAGLKANFVESVLFPSGTSTGRVLSIITPDAQRSMLTCLGAASEINPGEVTRDCFEKADVAHIEGYLLFNRDLMLAALDSAKKAGARISLDLASFTVVEADKDFLEKIVKEYVDILIANEDEAEAFTGHTDEDKALAALAENVEIAVLKLGERGSMISRNGVLTKVGREGTKPAVDTTGAGDLWAAGFLYGFVNGYSMEICGKLGSLCGFEVCQVVGANISGDGWDRIREELKSLK